MSTKILPGLEPGSSIVSAQSSGPCALTAVLLVCCSYFEILNVNRFHTVSGLNLDSSSDEEEGGQAFYAGGSTHSGQQVLGPARPRNQIVDEMFRSVKE